MVRRGPAFVDTGAFFGLRDSNDKNHSSARLVLAALIRDRVALFTSNFVLAEAHALILNRIGRRDATRFLRESESSNMAVIRVTESDERIARDIIYRYDDKDFSLTDATSFAVMRRLGIEDAFTFDRNFEQFGIRRINL